MINEGFQKLKSSKKIGDEFYFHGIKMVVVDYLEYDEQGKCPVLIAKSYHDKINFVKFTDEGIDLI